MKDDSVPLKNCVGRCEEYLQPNFRPGGGIELHSELLPSEELSNVNKITINKSGNTK